MTQSKVGTKTQKRRDKRWDKSVPFEQLPKGRQLAMRIVDGLEDSILGLHLAVLTFALVAHMAAPTRGFLSFAVFHETIARDYWLIEGMEHGEYGMWPGILTAMGTDAVAMLLIVLPAVLPFVIARHYIVRDEHSLKDVVAEFLGLSVLVFLLTYAVGSIAGTFLVLITAGAAGAFSDVGGLLAPVTSGIFMTDLLFATAMWWADRAAAPRGMSTLVRLGVGLGAGVALVFAVETGVSVEAGIDTDHDDAIVFVEGKEIAHEGKETGELREVGATFSPGEDGAEALIAPRDHLMLAFAEAQPFLHAREPFFHGPPDSLSYANRTILFAYELHPSTEKPKVTNKTLTLTPEPGKDFRDQFEHIVDSADSPGARLYLEVKALDVTDGVSFGLISVSTNEHLYILAEGREIRLKEIGSEELARVELDEPVERIALVDNAGAVVLVNGRPLWTLDTHRPTKMGPAMMRRPELQSDDRAKVRCTIMTAEARYDRPFLDPPF